LLNREPVIVARTEERFGRVWYWIIDILDCAGPSVVADAFFSREEDSKTNGMNWRALSRMFKCPGVNRRVLFVMLAVESQMDAFGYNSFSSFFLGNIRICKFISA
jgi:hypothetical protein